MKELIEQIPNNTEAYSGDVRNVDIFLPSKWRLNLKSIPFFWGFRILIDDLTTKYNLTFISTYRNIAHNMAVGGVYGSNHTKGFAFDVKMFDFEGKQVNYSDLTFRNDIQKIYNNVLRRLNKQMKESGSEYELLPELIFYPTFIHFGFDLKKKRYISKRG